MKIALVVLVCTQALNSLFVPLFQHAGLTLSIGVASLINAALLMWGLHRKKSLVLSVGWTSFAIKVIVSCSVMGLFLWFAAQRIEWLTLSEAPRVGWLCGTILLAMLIYFSMLRATGIKPQQFLKKV
jgi:putative peptidoglycan lipid II flippase